MTVEERIRAMIEEIKTCKTAADVQSVFRRTISATIEDCAKIGDEQAAFHMSEAERLSRNEDAANCERTGEHAAERIAAKIRALAAPTEQTERKEC